MTTPSHEPPHKLPRLGLGVGWRPELALFIHRNPAITFIELTAENIHTSRIPPAVEQLAARGCTILPHGVSLSLGSAEPIDPARAKHLANLAKIFHSPFVSEHLAFVRAGNTEAGHLLPVERSAASMQIVIDNIRRTQDLLPVPLAIENISALFEWPNPEFSDAEFLSQILEKTGCLLLLDTSNVYANSRNLRLSPSDFLSNLPLHRLAYCHVGGGIEDASGIYHDTHAASVTDSALSILELLCARTTPPGILLERDDEFPSADEFQSELQKISAARDRGLAARPSVQPA